MPLVRNYDCIFSIIVSCLIEPMQQPKIDDLMAKISSQKRQLDVAAVKVTFMATRVGELSTRLRAAESRLAVEQVNKGRKRPHEEANLAERANDEPDSKRRKDAAIPRSVPGPAAAADVGEHPQHDNPAEAGASVLMSSTRDEHNKEEEERKKAEEGAEALIVSSASVHLPALGNLLSGKASLSTCHVPGTSLTVLIHKAPPCCFAAIARIA